MMLLQFETSKGFLKKARTRPIERRRVIQQETVRDPRFTRQKVDDVKTGSQRGRHMQISQHMSLPPVYTRIHGRWDA